MSARGCSPEGMQELLVTPAQRHRQWVLAALESFEARLLGYAARLLHGDEESARDVVQHAFLRLCDQKEKEVGPHLAPWLFTVCRNRSLDLIRERCRREEWEGVLKANGHAAANECDPAADVEQHDLATELRSLLARLPAAQQEAIDLWAQGLAYREIAEVLGRGEVGVRVLVHRGLKSLREHPRVKKWLEDEKTGSNGSRTQISQICTD
jgi:RNA polymerase sigma-70 factor, ECF subfamily